MPPDRSYRIGDVGQNAVVQQGEYLYNLSLHLEDVGAAQALLDQIQQQAAQRHYRGPLLRRLDPLVLVNRRQELQTIHDFVERSGDKALFVNGIAGIGKSMLVRGALELRAPQTPAIWVICEGLEAEQLLAEIASGLSLDLLPLLSNSQLALPTKINAVLGNMDQRSLLVLDGFEALLDDDSRYRSPALAAVLQALLELEHRARLLITTRRLPHGVGSATPGVQILRLEGLGDDAAAHLFQLRAGLNPAQMHARLPAAAFARLQGHPKFIELLASALGEIPAHILAQEMINASDIGDYVLTKVLLQLGAVEHQLLDATFVFRHAFTLEAAAAVYHTLFGVDAFPYDALRALVRRAVLEPSAAGTAYYLHPILRDTVRQLSEYEAQAHLAAAAWFRQVPFNPADATTWDDGLYHLGQAALTRDGNAQDAYIAFLDQEGTDLIRAGWLARLTRELQLVEQLLDDPVARFNTRVTFAGALAKFGNAAEAHHALTRLLADLQQVSARFPEVDPAQIDEWDRSVHLGLAKAALRQDDLAAAQTHVDAVAAHMPGVAEPIEQDKYYSLRYDLARKRSDVAEMYRWANRSFEIAEEMVAQAESEDDRYNALDHQAEAHFKFATVYIHALSQLAADQLSEALEAIISHLVQQLRLKVEIGKLSGISAGLHNAGTIFQILSEPVTAAAMLVTAQQIDREQERDFNLALAPEEFEALKAELTATPENIAAGRQALGAITGALLPFYDRALAPKTS